MILTALRLKNFRQFQGEHELHFSTDEDKNITVVTGANGAGKTGIFLALNWCLYGAGTASAGQLISKGIDRSDGGFVEVHFRHEAVQYVARRELPVPGRRGGELNAFSMLELSRGRSDRVENPVQRLNEILPADVRTYFFFDGERIDEMTKPGHEAQVKDAIRSMLKLKVLERAITHLTAVEREFSNALRAGDGSNQEAADLSRQMESVNDALEGLKATREEKQAAVDALDRNLDDVMDRLRSLDGVREILIAEGKVDVELAALDARSEGQHETLAELIARSGAALAADALTAAGSMLDEKRTRGEIPSNIKQTLIDDLLEADVCICDRHLDEAARVALERRREGATSSDMEELVVQLTGSLGNLRHVAGSIPERLTSTLEQWSKDAERAEALQRRRDALRVQVDEELRGQTAEGVGKDAKDLEGARHRIETERGDLRFDLGGIDRDVAHFEEEFSKLSEQLKKIDTRSGAAALDKRRYELAYMARQAAQDLLVRFSDEMRRRIEDETDAIFKAMVWKKKAFEGVKIMDDYRLDVVDRFGTSAHHELSAGEREVLSLAFIVGMSKVTEEEAPLVIDTPFGRISKEPQKNIVASLPSLVEQLIVLVTDDELNDDAKQSLRKRVGAGYRIDYNDKTGASKLVEGGWDA